MAIKTRLILAMAALLCIATVMIGTVATTAVVGSMTDNIDIQLEEFMGQATELESVGDVRAETAEDKPLTLQKIAVLLVTPQGRIANAKAAGFSDDPMPLPKVPFPLPAAGTPITVGAESGQLEYRLMVSTNESLPQVVTNPDAENLLLVAAAPLDEVRTVRNSLNYTLVVTVAVVLVAGIIAAWWITRRGLRPVTNMIDAAAAVAGGDLDRRLPAHNQRTEIGKLATALNIMVSKLVDAITQRDSQQARLRRFIADASHELRTPLAAISGYAELYESGGVPPGPSLDRAISRIRSESGRMAALVDDLLLLARLDQETAGTRRPLDLRQLAYDCVDDARAADTGYVIDVHSDEPVIVSADEARIRQVIVNLLSNARTHTPPGTRILVTVQRHRNEAVLTVADNGPGIPLIHRQRVFDRFYRADDSRSRETGGTGLGLSIVKSIVDSHEGHVVLKSQLGKGTSIKISLPVCGEELPDKPLSVPPSTQCVIELRYATRARPGPALLRGPHDHELHSTHRGHPTASWGVRVGSGSSPLTRLLVSPPMPAGHGMGGA